jgi:hypothetical protein
MMAENSLLVFSHITTCVCVVQCATLNILAARHHMHSVDSCNSQFFRYPHRWTTTLSSLSPCCCCRFGLFLLFYYIHISLPLDIVYVPATKLLVPP